VRRAVVRDDLPLMPGHSDLFKRTETCHQPLFSVVKNQDQVNAIVEVTQSVIGDLEPENTGLSFVIPVS